MPDISPEDLNAVRDLTFEVAGPDDMLDFYSAAIVCGFCHDDAESIDAVLTVGVMRARGAI